MAADDVGSTYGFKVSSPEYRYAAIARRRRGGPAACRRATPKARIVADAQEACQSYGLHPYSDRCEQCAHYEHEARRPL